MGDGIRVGKLPPLATPASAGMEGWDCGLAASESEDFIAMPGRFRPLPVALPEARLEPVPPLAWTTIADPDPELPRWLWPRRLGLLVPPTVTPSPSSISAHHGPSLIEDPCLR